MALNKLYFLFVIQVVLNIYFLCWLNDIKSCKSSEINQSNWLISQWRDEIYQIGYKHRTSKITDHEYDSLYGMYLGPMRNRNESIRLLEIGLGCNMQYGPGKSILMWRDFISNVQLSMLEYDANCAEKFRDQLEHLFVGDQSNLTLLEHVASLGPYDAIIDDGGHTRKQQIYSLIGLWPAVKEGGFYVIEDMNFSYDLFANDYHETAFDLLMKIVHSLVFQDRAFHNSKMSFDNNLREKMIDILNSLLSVNCFKYACVLVKK